MLRTASRTAEIERQLRFFHHLFPFRRREWEAVGGMCLKPCFRKRTLISRVLDYRCSQKQGSNPLVERNQLESRLPCALPQAAGNQNGTLRQLDETAENVAGDTAQPFSGGGQQQPSHEQSGDECGEPAPAIECADAEADA